MKRFFSVLLVLAMMLSLAGNVQFAAIYPKSSLDNAGETGITEFIGTGPYKLAE